MANENTVQVICAASLGRSIGAVRWNNVDVLRVDPGGIDAALMQLRPEKTQAIGAAPALQAAPHAASGSLNWKGRTVALLRRGLDQLIFPDARALWHGNALRAALASARQRRPGLIIGSHEPAVGILAAHRLAVTLGVPWIAELGDPILAPYTPRHWRQRAFKLEREVFRQADAVVLTSHATANLLLERHGRARLLEVIPQGFDVPKAASDTACDRTAADPLRIVYTGRFYPFRDPLPLLSAVEQVDGVELVIAAPELPAEVRRAVQHSAGKLQYVGMLEHADAVALQASADLLASVGNAGMTQIPGKVLEYLGTGVPILHLCAGEHDAAAAIIREEKCGYVVAADRDEVQRLLLLLRDARRAGSMGAGLTLGANHFSKYRWETLGKALAVLCERVAASGPRAAGD
ncbi:glycosyltransferase [Xanthomonas melonis]|nr:glycosyltransferase [Xanthomonas melonis]MCD0260441.1 glycosyltransferase [Xanthomonas melonis]